MPQYKILKQQTFNELGFSITPIRYEDRFKIMQWRNEQIYHLRQNKPLSIDDQNQYFDTTILNLFNSDQPNQLLFSFLKDDECIGYGGLVHINWIDKHSEISFIMNTELEQQNFVSYWIIFLNLIEKVAFNELNLNKIFTYAFDLRPKLYDALNAANFKLEARLINHCFFQNQFKDVLIHSKFNAKLEIIKATKKYLDITYKWANNSIIREFSLNKDFIEYDNHVKWFNEKINNENTIYLVIEHANQPIGSIRYEIENDKALISYLIDPTEHGKGYGSKLIELGETYILNNHATINCLYGYVLKNNIPSIKLFTKNDYKKIEIDATQFKFEKNIR